MPASSAGRKNGNLSLYRIADDAVFSLCESVCGSVQRQLDELHELLEVVTMSPATGRSSACSSRSPAR